MVRAARRGRVEPETRPGLIERIRGVSTPLRGSRDLDPLLERIGDARFVLLGEASHGTAEYYEWRGGNNPPPVAREGLRVIALRGGLPPLRPPGGDNKRRGGGGRPAGPAAV